MVSTSFLMRFYLATSTLDMVNIRYVNLKQKQLHYQNIQSWNFQIGIGKSTGGTPNFFCQRNGMYSHNQMKPQEIGKNISHIYYHLPHRVSASAFFGHEFRRPQQAFLIFCRRVNKVYAQYIKKLEATLDKVKSYFYMVEYCEVFEMAIFENSRFSALAQNSLLSYHKVIVTTEKVKTVIQCNFLLSNFKSRRHPTHSPIIRTSSCYKMGQTFSKVAQIQFSIQFFFV